MKWSVPLGRVFGIPIRVHSTFLLLVSWVAWLGWEENGLGSSLWAMALLICLFVCVVLHELGHSLVAMRFGAKVHGVTLLPFGGVANMRSIPERPLHEFLMAIAGPFVNVLIVSALLATRGVFPSFAQTHLFPRNSMELADTLILANIGLAVFNLIPAFPMDGGRVFRSLLAIRLPYVSATRAASRLGQVLAVAFIYFGTRGNPVLVVIGIAVFLLAGMEERSVSVRTVLRGVPAGAVMSRSFTSLHPDMTLGQCLELSETSGQQSFPVLLEDKIVGILAKRKWKKALCKHGPEMKVGDVMQRCFLTVHPKAALSRLYQDAPLLGQDLFPVVEDGRMTGIVSLEAILQRAGIRSSERVEGRTAGRFGIDVG